MTRRQSEINEQIGKTFASYLRAFLRHDPEVIMVGETRDQETAETAFRAAQTGHLLLSTLHTNSAVGVIPRLMDLNIDPNTVASSLIGVVGQRLVRQICETCKKACEPSSQLLREFFQDASARSSTSSMAESAWQLIKEGQTNLEELIRMLPYQATVDFRHRRFGLQDPLRCGMSRPSGPRSPPPRRRPDRRLE